MGALKAIEILLILAAAVLIWRRTRPADAPYGKPLLLAALALLVQGALLYAVSEVLEGIVNDAGTVHSAAWKIWGLQLVRAVLVMFALAMWLRIAKPKLTKSWRGVVIAIALILATVVPDVPALAPILVIIVLLRLKWTGNVSGWRRFAGFLATLLLLVVTSIDINFINPADGDAEVQLSFSGNPSVFFLEDNIPDSAAGVAAATRPWDNVIRVAGLVLRWQILIACLQFLVFPIRLRGLSLKRRFTVTMILYRVIPGFLGFAAAVLAIYFGFGLHKTRLAQEAFSDTLDRNMQAAGKVVDAAVEGGWPARVGEQPVRSAFAEARDWIPGGEGVQIVVKHVGLRATTTFDSTETPSLVVDTIYAAIATPGAAAWFTTTDLFNAGAADSVRGMSVADTVLFLAAARSYRDGDEAVVAEVYTPLDVEYIARIADLVHADVRLRARPNIFIGESTVTIGGDEGWADSSFVVKARATGADIEDRGGFWRGSHFLARSYIPVSDWSATLSGVRGAAELTLNVSPHRMLTGIVSNQLVFSSNAIAVLIFLAILLLFLIAEYSAARTGRSIIRGILDDVKGLAEAAGRFGQGDLDHRIEVRGRDELGSLSASFNTMAQNIEEHQETLLEKERLEADLSLARDIQQRMLPQSPPILPGLDVAGLSIPSREVGGDLFYFLPVPVGRLGLTIGDVSGKSVPAALLMSNVLAALKTEARLVKNEDQILAHLNGLIVEQVEPGRFVTFFYGVIDRSEMQLTYACAGHNPPLLVRQDGSTEWLSEAGMPLGVLADHTYTPADVELRVGDVLVLYSDGVTEAERPSAAEEPEFFDEDRLEQAVRDARGKTASEVIQAVVDSVNVYTGGSDLSDDLTLVVVKITD